MLEYLKAYVGYFKVRKVDLGENESQMKRPK